MECYPIFTECEPYSVTPVLVAPYSQNKGCEDPPMGCPRLPQCPKPVMYCCEGKPPKAVYICEKKPEGGSCPPPRRPEPHPTASQQKPSRGSDCDPACKPVKTKYIMPCYRYEDGRIVRKLPVSAFKRNGMQDQEHSKLLGTANFLVRSPQDVSVESHVCLDNLKVADPAKVPPWCTKPALQCNLKKKPIETNQTTVLMRRACEVACGARARRKPFVESSYFADGEQETRRYHSEDDKGNCCIHFERNNRDPHQSASQASARQPSSHNGQCVPTGPFVPSPECQFIDCVAAEPCGEPSSCFYCKPTKR